MCCSQLTMTVGTPFDFLCSFPFEVRLDNKAKGLLFVVTADFIQFLNNYEWIEKLEIFCLDSWNLDKMNTQSYKRRICNWIQRCILVIGVFVFEKCWFSSPWLDSKKLRAETQDKGSWCLIYIPSWWK